MPHTAPEPGRPAVLGHRGASASAPENTLAAFRLAVAQGADGVELDVRRCASGEVVVLHDEDTGRVAGEALRVDQSPWAALRRLDAGAHRGAAFQGERIPLLAEVLEALPAATVNVELKAQGRDLRLAEAAAGVIRRAGAAGRVIVSSFDPWLLAAFRRAAPEVRRGLLLDGRLPALRAAFLQPLLRPAALHPAARLATAGRVRRWRADRLTVNVWTVDQPEEAVRLAGLGVDALITNVPDRILAALRARVRELLDARGHALS